MLNPKIKLITDSCSDIPIELANELDILMLCFPVTVDGESFREVQDISKEEFYEKLESARDFPTTAGLTPFELHETFASLYAEDYTDVVYVTIGSGGSATYKNALLAKQQFEDEDMSADRPMHIHIVDGRNYTATYGYGVTEAARMLKRGANVTKILDYLEDWNASAGLYFVPMSLKILKKSGRVSAAAAFAGGVLGLRPLCEIIDCKSAVTEKIRGESSIIPRLAELAKSRMIPKTPYVVMRGSDPSYAEAMTAYMTKLVGYPPAAEWSIGATIACNAGASVVGIIIKQQNRGALPVD